MARPLRITFPGAFYHVTSRGNERKAVFKSKRDREKYLEYLESAIQKGRKNNRVRDIAIYLARDVTGKTAVRLGEYFGNISGSAITLRYNHMAKQKEKSKNTDGLAAKIRRIVLNNY